jgi:nicotinate-nucleotide adenylyltransferase
MKRIAYFGGTFDPVHNGHLAVGRSLVEEFQLDEFVFLPAFHAPHKPDRIPTSAYHRFTMLALATQNDTKLTVATLELDKREKRYTVDTLKELHATHPEDHVFFVMGADSWEAIRTWRDWESVLLGADHIVVTRPGSEVVFEHVTDAVRERIIDIRGGETLIEDTDTSDYRIYITDAVHYDISATELRTDLADGDLERTSDVPAEVAKYIEKYELYS